MNFSISGINNCLLFNCCNIKSAGSNYTLCAKVVNWVISARIFQALAVIGLGISIIYLWGLCRNRALQQIPTTKAELLQFLGANPARINEKINFEMYRDVYLSHLLVSGKLFPPAPQDKEIELLQAVIPHINFSLIDESNLWQSVGVFRQGGSGNNVLKSAVASSSASISGRPERRVIVAALLDYLQQNKDKETCRAILDQGDNFPLGAHTIPDFLVRQGNEDLALKAVHMGATINADLLLSALASAGTTNHGTALARHVLQHYVNERKQLSREEHWKAAICLSAASTQSDVLDLIHCSDHKKYWEQTKYADCMHSEWKAFGVFERFSNQYRKDDPTPWDARLVFLETAEGQQEFLALQTLFREITSEALTLRKNKGP